MHHFSPWWFRYLCPFCHSKITWWLDQFLKRMLIAWFWSQLQTRRRHIHGYPCISLTTVTFASQLVYCHIFFCKWPCSKTFFDVPWLHCRNPRDPRYSTWCTIPWDRVPHERVGPGNKTSHDSQLKSLVMKLKLLCSDTQPARTYLLALWSWADSKKMGTALSGVSGNEADNATDLYGTPYHV